MSRKRLSTLFSVLALVVLAGAVSWFAGSKIQSPAEAAARTAPPTPSPILVPIEERVLTSDVVTRGTARYGLPQSLSLVPSALKPDVGVVATLPPRNAQVHEGDVLLTASGRPVFVLQGATPVYRDLAPGVSGDDVAQLESALERLGFAPGPVDGVYDEQTGTAVAAWYEATGWQPFGATAEQVAHIRTLEQEVAAATNDKLAAEAAVATAALAVDAAQVEMWANGSAAEANIQELTAALDTLVREAAPQPDRDVATARLAAAKAAAGAAYSSGQAAVQAAKDAQAAAERDEATAVALLQQITADLETARRDAGVKVPSDEIVFIPTLPVRVEQVDVVVGDAAGGPMMTVTDNQLAIDSSLPLNEAPLVKPGMAVAIDEPDLGIKAQGVVSTVASNPGTNGVDGFHIYFEALVDEAPTSLEGFSLRLTIPVESTGGAVLVAPISALSLAADGSSRVQVDNDGTLESVSVEPGLSADGFVELIPVDGAIAPGQLVVIGFEQ